MTRTDRFRDLDEVHALRLRLRAERDARAEDLKVHWHHIKDKDFRRALVLDAAADLFRRENSGGALGVLAEGVKLAGGWLPVVGPMLAGRKGLMGSRLFWSGVSVIVPFLVRKDAGARIGELWEGVRDGIQRVREFALKRNGVQVEDE